MRVVGPTAIKLTVFMISLGGALTALLFLHGKVRIAYVALATLTVLKALVVLQDFRLTHTQHYIAFWVTAVYLLVPGKRRALMFLIVAIYSWAGLLKLNWDWVSGQALYGRRPLGLPPDLIPAACVYVIVLELVLVYGLLARRKLLFWPALAQFLLFQVSSFWVIGWFYPVLMFLILALFPLNRLIPEKRSMSSATERRGAIVVAGLFSVCQLIPALYSGEAAVTGEGRMFALYMFDAPITCTSWRMLHAPDGTSVKIVVRPHFVHARIACDPLIYYQLARNECDEYARRGVSIDFDLMLDSKKSSWPSYRRVVQIPAFCGSGVSYRVWSHNVWIDDTRRSPE